VASEVATGIRVVPAAVLIVATGVLIALLDSVVVAAAFALVVGVVVIAVIVPSLELATVRQIEGMRWRRRYAQQRDQQPDGVQPVIRSHLGFLLRARRVMGDDTATDTLTYR
jgi:hypothetical protein